MGLLGSWNLGVGSVVLHRGSLFPGMEEQRNSLAPCEWDRWKARGTS
jgi:hypothetical protein